MKKNVILLICLMFSLIALGQKETKKLMVDIEEVEVSPPKFTGIDNAATLQKTENATLINSFLLKNVIYPGKAIYCREGTEVIKFTVTPSGDLTNFNIVNSVCKEIDKEVIRVLETTNGMWQPGFNNGKATAMEQEVSMLFGDYKKSEIVKNFVQKAVFNYKEGSKDLFVNHKPKKALKHYNIGVRYLPNDKGLLMLRGVCNYELGNIEKARSDWDRLINLGGIDMEDVDNKIVEMKGYKELINILAQNND